MIPYLATTLAELVSLKEAMPSYVEGDLINFTKMRRVISASESHVLITIIMNVS